MEAKISMEGKSPVLSSCGAAEPPTLENSKKSEIHLQSRAQSSERDKMVSMINQTLAILPGIVMKFHLFICTVCLYVWK